MSSGIWQTLPRLTRMLAYTQRLALVSCRLRSTTRLAIQNPTTSKEPVITGKLAAGIRQTSGSNAIASNDFSLSHDNGSANNDPSKVKVRSWTDLSDRDGNPHERKPIDIINSIVKFRNSDHQFWWENTGAQLSVLLEHAGYKRIEQYNELLFFAIHIIPKLGPVPDHNGHLRWRSPHTPDGTPLDFSWEWGLGGKGVIRTSFEPIGPFAGTEVDPLNHFETDLWIKHLKSQDLVAGLDLEWYRHFTKTILPNEPIAPSKLHLMKMSEKNNFEVAPVAGTFVTRDIDRHGPIVKMYMFPGLRAQELGISKTEVVSSAIKSLPEGQYQSLNFEPLQAYLREAAAKWSMEIHIFSFDLISPQKSRIKIYTRAPNTSIEYLMDALTLGGRHDLSMYSAEVIQDVQDFWRIFIGDAPDVFTQSGAERAPGFYFTVKADQPTIPKVYISPAPFCENDLEVLKRLRRYFATRRDAARMLPQMDIYEKALKSIYGTDYLEKTSDIHVYVSCALQEDQLRVVTYLCPQTLAREAEARKLQISSAREL